MVTSLATPTVSSRRLIPLNVRSPSARRGGEAAVRSNGPLAAARPYVVRSRKRDFRSARTTFRCDARRNASGRLARQIVRLPVGAIAQSECLNRTQRTRLSASHPHCRHRAQQTLHGPDPNAEMQPHSSGRIDRRDSNSMFATIAMSGILRTSLSVEDGAVVPSPSTRIARADTIARAAFRGGAMPRRPVGSKSPYVNRLPVSECGVCRAARCAIARAPQKLSRPSGANVRTCRAAPPRKLGVSRAMACRQHEIEIDGDMRSVGAHRPDAFPRQGNRHRWVHVGMSPKACPLCSAEAASVAIAVPQTEQVDALHH